MTDDTDTEEGSGLDELRAFLHRTEERRQLARKRMRDAAGAIPYLTRLESTPHALGDIGEAEANDRTLVGFDRATFLVGYSASLRRMKSEISKVRGEAEVTLTGEAYLGDYLASEVEPELRTILDILDAERLEDVPPDRDDEPPAE